MKRVLVLLIVFVLLSLFVVPSAMAMAPRQSAPFGDVLSQVVVLIGGLVGFPAALAGILALAIRFGLPAAYAATITFWANAAAFVGIFYLVLTGQVPLVSSIDATLGHVAQLIAYILLILGGPVVSYMLTGHFTRSIGKVRAAFFETRELLLPNPPALKK